MYQKGDCSFQEIFVFICAWFFHASVGMNSSPETSDVGVFSKVVHLIIQGYQVLLYLC